MTSLPTPDLYIAAVGRSGSTMLANLFTTPPGRWVIIEPRFVNATTGSDVIRQAIDLGIDIDPDDWDLLENESPEERIVRVFAQRLRSLERWGLKQVRPDILTLTSEVLRPKKTIVLVRDLRAVAASLARKIANDDDSTYDDYWLRRYLYDSPRAVMDLLGSDSLGDHRVVRYEDLVTNPLVREDLAEWVGWPMDGLPGRHLKEIYGREREVELHQNQITTKSLNQDWGSDPRTRELAEWIHRESVDYQRRFGYA